jgi:hypothetical protein
MRHKINDSCNVVTEEHSTSPRGFPQITVPHLRLRLYVGEAEGLVKALQEAIAFATGRAAEPACDCHPVATEGGVVVHHKDCASRKGT